MWKTRKRLFQLVPSGLTSDSLELHTTGFRQIATRQCLCCTSSIEAIGAYTYIPSPMSHDVHISADVLYLKNFPFFLLY